MAFNRSANSLAHDKADAHRFGGVGLCGWQQVNYDRSSAGPKWGPGCSGEVGTAPEPMGGSKHCRVDSERAEVGRLVLEGLGRQLGAALATTGGENATASARAHAVPETVRLGTTTVVGLVRTLRHNKLHTVLCIPWLREPWPTSLG